MTRARLLAEADSEELSGWMAWEKARPPTIEQHLLATICALICQFGGNKAAKAEDFLPDRPKARTKTPPALVRARFAAVGQMIAARERAKGG